MLILHDISNRHISVLLQATVTLSGSGHAGSPICIAHTDVTLT